VLLAFASLFTHPSWLRAQALLCGALLAPANHTVTAALRALGLADEPGFQNYHRLLNRAHSSAEPAAHRLLKPFGGSLCAGGSADPGGSKTPSNAAGAVSWGNFSSAALPRQEALPSRKGG
jgi:hypothetical protein